MSVSADRIKGTIECDLCHFVVQEVETWLSQNQTQTFIIKQIDRLCNTDLFKNNAKVCEAILTFGVEEFIAFIEQAETPENVCGPDQLNLCSNKRFKEIFA